jgi:hypothetical protein
VVATRGRELAGSLARMINLPLHAVRSSVVPG